jgi:hypothetical protein
MSVGMALGGVATLLGAAVLAAALQKVDVGSRLIYLLCLAASLAILSMSCAYLLLGSVTAPTAWLPVGQPWIGAHFRMDALAGLLVFVLITLSTPLVIEIIRRFGWGAVRRGPTWDCGYRELSPVTQYTGDSFSRPIHRVFSPVVFQARERVDMPLSGDARPARLTVTMRDLPWDAIYVPTAEVIWFAAEELNHLQFLTIRKYLSLMFVALVALLLTVALWH